MVRLLLLFLAALLLFLSSRREGLQATARIHGLPYSDIELNRFYADFPPSAKDAFIPGLANLQGQTQAQMDQAKKDVIANIKKYLGDMVDQMFVHYYTPLTGGVINAEIDAAVDTLLQRQLIVPDTPPAVIDGLKVVFKQYFNAQTAPEKPPITS